MNYDDSLRAFPGGRQPGPHVPPMPREMLSQATCTHMLAAVASQRLHYLEDADVLRMLNTSAGMSMMDMARSTGLTVQQIEARMHLAVIEGELRTLLMAEHVPERIARALLTLPERSRLSAAHRIARERLCIRDAELLIASILRRATAQPPQRAAHRGRIITLIRDHRPYLNAIRDIAAQMKDAGVDATVTERKVGRSVALTVTLPTRRRRAARHHK